VTTNTLPEWDEKRIRELVCKYLVGDLRHVITCPNLHCFGWESDIVSLTASLVVHEIEIKCCRSDYLREFRSSTPGTKTFRRKCYDGTKPQWERANYFWFAVAPGVLNTVDEVPEWAGVLLMDDSSRGINLARPAPKHFPPRLKRERVRDYCMRGLNFRTWAPTNHTSTGGKNYE